MKARIKRIAVAARKLDLLFLILIVWEIFARCIYPRFEPRAAIYLPPFSKVVAEFWMLLTDGILLTHFAASIRRIMIGFSAAALCGVSIGIITGLSKRTYWQVRGICDFLRPIPPVAWIPISLLWFGITNTQQSFIIFIGVFFPILLHTIIGVHAVPEEYKRAARALGSDGFSILRKVIFPAVLPRIFFGLRSGLSFAWFIIVAAEFVSAPDGLGYLILEGRNVIITERIFVGMICIGLANIAMYYALTKIENVLVPWAKFSFTE
ncbi:MAG: ABC transporter permease [Elusimicrobiota bacterium]